MMASQHIINEPPLLVLPSLARKVGINHAILLQQMHYWLNTSKHERDGHRWVYNTYAEWQEQLPWLSVRGIRKLISELERDGYLVAANHNRARFDQTKWYRIDYERLTLDFSDASQSVTSSGTKCQTMSHKVSDDASQSDHSDVSQSVTPIPETTETTAETTVPKKPAKRKPEVAFPDDFTVDGDALSLAIEQGMTEDRARYQFERMKNWAAYQDVRRRDWMAQWRNWVLKDIRDNGKGDGGNAWQLHKGGRADDAPTERPDLFGAERLEYFRKKHEEEQEARRASS